MGLGSLVKAYPNHSIHMVEEGDGSRHSMHITKGVGPQSTKGVGSWDAR